MPKGTLYLNSVDQLNKSSRRRTLLDEKKKPVRRPLPAHLDRVEKTIDLSDEEKAALGGLVGIEIRRAQP